MGDSIQSSEEPKVSKAAAKKAAQKAEKAQKKAEHVAKVIREKASSKTISDMNGKSIPLRPKKDAGSSLSVDEDPMDSTFDVGWLKDVYQIEPVGKDTVTRFPPEPNGFLHIGHAKAIAVNFGFAKKRGGKCYLRYDDTNPEKEDEVYFTSIKETVEWLGYAPYEITHSSDRFDRLYELAELLIQKDKAYVCSCTQEETFRQRGGKDGKEGPRFACAHRDRPIAESLAEFRAMRDGKYKSKERFLRMKMNLLDSGNPNMWDAPAYRIPEEGKNIHHRTHDKWRIYPTYDFTHCLCDAMEHISHSLCTTEFRLQREAYDWVVEELKDHLPAIPQQREYGRLNVTGTVLSKRKIQQLVQKKTVRDWDDPRLYTIIALRRRGIPPGAIRAFVADLGVSDSYSTIQTVRLESTVRKYLERTVPRLMLIPDPVKVVITNLPPDYHELIRLDFLKGGDEEVFGSHEVPFTGMIYINRSDFRAHDDPNFFRLTPGKTVGLLNVQHAIKATSFTTDPEDSTCVTEIQAEYLSPEINSDSAATPNPKKPQAFIQWVAESKPHNSPISAEVRIFRPLFRSDNPDNAPGGFLEDVNPHSEENHPNALIESGFDTIRRRAPWPKDFLSDAQKHKGPWDIRFQGVRVAYFAVDVESKYEGEGRGKLVLNQIVPLKEDVGK